MSGSLSHGNETAVPSMAGVREHRVAGLSIDKPIFAALVIVPRMILLLWSRFIRLAMLVIFAIGHVIWKIGLGLSFLVRHRGSKGLSRANRRMESAYNLDKWGFTELLLKRFSTKWSYERHLLSTKDGYELCMFRIIPLQQKRNDNGERRVIIMQHGLLENSCIFLVLGEESLAYRLCVHHGYEVWLSNARSWQRPDLPQYSIDELIVDDFPAIIDHVIRVSEPSNGKVAFLGVSQGTVQALGAMAVHGQPLEKKLSMLVLVSPALYTKKLSWFRRGWCFLLLMALPKITLGTGEFFHGLLGFSGLHVPLRLMPFFSWLAMSQMLGVLHQPMFQNFIPSPVDEIMDNLDEDIPDQEADMQAMMHRHCRDGFSVDVNENVEALMPYDDEGKISTELLTTQSWGKNNTRVTSKQLKLHELCFRYLPGSPCTSTRNVMHWMDVIRNGSTLHPLRDDHKHLDYDYLRRVMTRHEKRKHDNSEDISAEYTPPMHVLMGGLDPVINQSQTRLAIQHLIETHPDGTRRYVVQEELDFSHVCFFWGHSSVVNNVYTKIIGQIENNSDWS